ncbi:MAG: OadG family protein [Chloroflexi bacterium]|nr:OadG family protein [Chloroflexota bacterium]
MQPDIGLALQITFIGMSLVFAAIILLWGLMAALVRVTSQPENDETNTRDTQMDHDRKQQAAAIAVAVALAQQADHKSLVYPFPLPPTAIVSAWQAVTRSTQLQRRGPR